MYNSVCIFFQHAHLKGNIISYKNIQGDRKVPLYSQEVTFQLFHIYVFHCFFMFSIMYPSTKLDKKKYLDIDLAVRVFANGPGDLGSIQRLKKWYLMPPCLALSIIRYGSRVKWSNPGKLIAPSPTPWCSSYRKGSFGLPSTTVANFTYFIPSAVRSVRSLPPKKRGMTCL